MSLIRVLIADDHAIVRDGLRKLLDREANMEVLGEARDGQETLDLAKRLRPDLIILDIAMPKVGGLVCLPLLRKLLPKAKIIILSMYEKDSYAEEVKAGGADGYVLKAVSSEKILTAVRRVMGGRSFFEPSSDLPYPGSTTSSTASSKAHHHYHRLTVREKEIFFLIIKGNSTCEISTFLCISPKTVEKHRAHICRKIGIRSPLDLARYALRCGLIDSDYLQT